MTRTLLTHSNQDPLVPGHSRNMATPHQECRSLRWSTADTACSRRCRRRRIQRCNFRRRGPRQDCSCPRDTHHMQSMGRCRHLPLRQGSRCTRCCLARRTLQLGTGCMLSLRLRRDLPCLRRTAGTRSGPVQFARVRRCTESTEWMASRPRPQSLQHSPCIPSTPPRRSYRPGTGVHRPNRKA
eukprot:COSAG03_NODE_2087_length_3143_cov_33.161629_3_plen_183_part_00